MQPNAIVAKVDTLLENIKNITFPASDSKNVNGDTKKIVLPYVGVGRSAMVFQDPKKTILVFQQSVENLQKIQQIQALKEMDYFIMVLQKLWIAYL